MDSNIKTLFSLDISKVTLNSRMEIFYWTQRFEVSEDQIRLALQCVGREPMWVQMFFD